MEDELLSTEGEILYDETDSVITEENLQNQDDDLLLSEDEEALFDINPVNSGDGDLESSSGTYSPAHQQVGDEVFNLSDNLETLNDSAEEISRVGDGAVENQADQNQADPDQEEILQSLQVIQRNVKTGFDNLSLIGSVQVGLISFGIGAIIIYCYIGRFR